MPGGHVALHGNADRPAGNVAGDPGKVPGARHRPAGNVAGDPGKVPGARHRRRSQNQDQRQRGGEQRRPPGNPARGHLAASQSGPTPTSTASGGSISNAPPICSVAIRSTSAVSSSGPSNSSSS